MTGCTADSVPVLAGMHLMSVEEGVKALLACDDGTKFPTPDDGFVWCEDDQWSGAIPPCRRTYCSGSVWQDSARIFLALIFPVSCEISFQKFFSPQPLFLVRFFLW